MRSGIIKFEFKTFLVAYAGYCVLRNYLKSEKLVTIRYFWTLKVFPECLGTWDSPSALSVCCIQQPHVQGGHEAPSTSAPRSDLGNVYFLIQFTFKEISAILPREIRNFGHITPCICFSLYEVTHGILEEIIAQRIKPTQTIKGCITHVR